MDIRSPAAGHPDLAYPILVADIGGTNARFGLIRSIASEPQIAEELDGQAFRRNFEGTGSHVDLLRRIPVRIVTDPFPAFRGLSELTRQPGDFVFDFSGRARVTMPRTP